MSKYHETCTDRRENWERSYGNVSLLEAKLAPKVYLLAICYIPKLTILTYFLATMIRTMEIRKVCILMLERNIYICKCLYFVCNDSSVTGNNYFISDIRKSKVLNA